MEANSSGSIYFVVVLVCWLLLVGDFLFDELLYQTSLKYIVKLFGQISVGKFLNCSADSKPARSCIHDSIQKRPRQARWVSSGR